ncbi:sugar ABC transporter ATP-binding protein [Ruania zhangjianzhongii]|uniref:sugar ABC transporter ATP-binding protein n=1 Tax=Ruania zhangjianzhongii TaxID=2603206 RepID=UPI0011CA73E1|nr:sugar ABC transporter ATP-binding protein [Ruania zhangjianzhongii]
MTAELATDRRAAPAVPILEVRELSKSFPGVDALKRVSFTVGAGECHALVGENGAGKSTLCKCVIGEYSRTSGEVLIGGEVMSPHFDVADSQKRGIAAVHQELQLAPELTVVENIFMGKYLTRGPFVDRAAQRARAAELLDDLGVTMPLNARVKDLRTVEKQFVQLARALASDASLIVLDELTAVLPEEDIEKIMAIISRLKAAGKGIIYISHRLDEIFEICDTYTVLRDGEHVENGNVAGLTKDRLVELVAGRPLDSVFPPIASPQPVPLLEVSELTSDSFTDVGLTVNAGEVVGVAGLVGAGKTELLRALFGDYALEKGTITVKGKRLTRLTPRKAIAHGLGYIPDDRKSLGVNGALSVGRNASLSAIRKFSTGPFVSRRQENTAARAILAKLGLKYRSLTQGILSLSGGNQQKVVIAKWLLADTDIFLMDEPTRGIDVGAKSAIYELITELTAAGKAVLLVSPEVEELIGLSNRVYILYEGKVRDVVTGARKDQPTITAGILGI